MTTRKRAGAMPSKDTPPKALPTVDGQPAPGSKTLDGLADETNTDTWAYWQPLPNAFWDADTTVQQELLASALQQAYPTLVQRLADAGLAPSGTPRVRFSVEVDTQVQP